MTDNLFELNDMRRIKNMEKTIKLYESHLADLKKASNILKPHREFLFFSITYHAMYEEQKKITAELLKLRIRLDRVKSPRELQND